MDFPSFQPVKAKSPRCSQKFTKSMRILTSRSGSSSAKPRFERVLWWMIILKNVQIIPNILEAFIRFDLEVLQSWCHERVSFIRFFWQQNEILENFNATDCRIDRFSMENHIFFIFVQAYTQLSTVVKEYTKMHWSTKDSRIIDIDRVEMATGKMMEQGPVLIITFRVYMINVTKNADGKVVEGDPVSIEYLNFHVCLIQTDCESCLLKHFENVCRRSCRMLLKKKIETWKNWFRKILSFLNFREFLKILEVEFFSSIFKFFKNLK